VIEESVLSRVLGAALRTGGDFAEVFVEDRRTAGGRLDDGRVEELTSGRDRGAGIRVVVGDSTGFAHTSDLSEAGLLAAAEAAAAACTIGDFYWEIGDGNGVIASGAIGTTYGADTPMNIASASKLVFGAYVVERYKTDLAQADWKAMTMQSGYVSLSYTSCVGVATVDDCLAQGLNGYHSAGKDGAFDYDGGHFQHYASAGLGLGGDDDALLAHDLGAVVGPDLGFTYSSPQLAAGIAWTPAGYARFLREIIDRQLAIHDHMSDTPVCTLPGSPGCNAVYSPAAPFAWHYSWGHWIEDDASIGDDGAFSSAGAFGFERALLRHRRARSRERRRRARRVQGLGGVRPRDPEGVLHREVIS
jgi:hypothetical protein